MKLEVRNNKDFWAGMMLTGTGSAAVIAARNYPFGTTLRMGPGYFPTVLGGLLVLFGLYILIRGLRACEKIRGGWSLRALIGLPLSLVLFGLLIERLGFIPAMVTLVFLSAASGREFKVVEVLLVAVLLTVISVAVFIWGLGLPYPMIQGL